MGTTTTKDLRTFHIIAAGQGDKYARHNTLWAKMADFPISKFMGEMSTIWEERQDPDALLIIVERAC